MSTIDYDTTAIRSEALKIKKCCDQLSGAALPRIKGARSKLEGNFRGRTADALDGSLEKVQRELHRLNDGMNSAYEALMRYADALEEVDTRLVQVMRGR